MEQFRSLQKRAQIEFVERKSRFIGIACPHESVQEAEAYLASLRAAYRDASHVVFAFRFQLPETFNRFSDDGEPKGTAGPPLLDLLAGRELIQCGVYVVRYFGGTLLGTGGLVHAYSKAGAEAIEQAGDVLYQRMEQYEVNVDYERFGRLQDGLTRRGYAIIDIVYLADVTCHVMVPVMQDADFHKLVNDLTAGQVLLTPQGKRFQPVLDALQ